jgi:DNA repair exonuclease SbcCD ATPase subunit
VAGQLFSSDYGDLVEKNKRLWELQAKREHFMSMLDQISRDLVGADELGVALTPESIGVAEQKLKEEESGIADKRAVVLSDLRATAEQKLGAAKEPVPDVEAISERLMQSEAQHEELGAAIRHTSERLSEMKTVRQLLTEESAKLSRAQEASYVLADLRVTHCPACDQELEKRTEDHACYVCKKNLPAADASAGTSKRIEFETEQVQSELEETKELIDELERDLNKRQLQQRELTNSIAELKALLRPIRQAAAAVLPPELFVLDANYGRIQEKARQLARIRSVLSHRESLAGEIQKVKEEISAIENTVETRTNEVDFETLADHLRDGINTYLNRIKQLNPNSWLGSQVSVRLAERSFKFKLGESGWETKLGGTQRLYFLFAYQYALLSLAQSPDSLYPGFLMLDFPANLEDRAAIADKENFILEPFVDLLQKKEMKGCQVIAAGRSFKGLNRVHAIELEEVWK